MLNFDSNVLTVAPQAVVDLVEKFAEHTDTDKEIAIVEDATRND